MVNGINSNFANAYIELLEKVPECGQKIESGKFLNNDILAIARSVLVQKRDDGSISIKVVKRDRFAEIPQEEITLLRKIFSEHSHEVLVVRRGKKHKLEDEEDRSEPSLKKQMKSPEKYKSGEEIREAEFIFDKKSNTPDVLLGLMADYVNESLVLVLDIASKGKEIPKYLKDNLTELDLSKESLTFETFKTIVSEFKKLKSIKLPSNADNSWLEELSKECLNLSTLYVTGFKITDDGLRYIETIKSLKNLDLDTIHFSDEVINHLFKELKLEKLSFGSYKTTDEAFKDIKECGESLQELRLRGYMKLSDKAVGYIVDGVKSLKKLDLDQVEISNDMLDRVIQEFESLEHLSVYTWSINDNGLINLNQLSKSLKSFKLDGTNNVNGKFLSHIEHSFDNLKNFCISPSCDRFFASNLVHISRKLPVLENLYLQGMKELTDEIIEIAFKGMHKLESLDLIRTNVGDRGLEFIARECPNLKTLHISGCCNVSSLGIKAIFEGCLNLEKLSIEGIDDGAFNALVNKPGKLTYLNVENASKITDKGLESISIGCPDLKRIRLSGCNKITDDGVLHLSNGIKALQEFEISGSRNISNEICNHILKWKNSLHNLSVWYCSHIDDEALNHLSVGLPNLERLCLGGTSITDSGLSCLKYFPKLTDLNLVDCSNITDECFNQIISCPSLRHVALWRTKVAYNMMDKLRSIGIK